jgi:Tol biopolymer transport system component
MMLAVGARIGPYEVVAPIGAGGMGEVYRARDERLNRDVALKVLPRLFADDPERLARFKREARLLASLNHPNIGALYGIEENGDAPALVLELVEGPTLAEHIERGPIPLEDAIEVGRQIAMALEVAHERGIVHRDLKPSNIKVRPDGTVKVLDFGLAKAPATEPAGDPWTSPTQTAAATRAGVILGTAAYMAPEQAKGREADKRADIWAFGCVLYEMLAGKRAFEGEDVSDTLASVLRAEPDWSALPAETTSEIRRLLRRCLSKDRRERLHDIGDARLDLQEALQHTPTAEGAAELPSGRRRERVAWAIAAVALLVSLVVIALGTRTLVQRAPATPNTVRFVLSAPDGWSFPDAAGFLAVSPDGQRLTFVASGPEGKTRLWIRRFDALSPQPLAGTDGASAPFWSPDGRSIGFFSDGKLKRIELAGGPPTNVCDAADTRGGTWGRDGTIVFSPGQAALRKVPASGGVATPATTLGEGERAHWRPSFLPDGRHFLYRAHTPAQGSLGGPIYIASIDSPQRQLLFQSDSSNVAYAQSHLLFLRGTTLMAQAFDDRKLALKGEPFPLVEPIGTVGTPPYGIFSASGSGTLVYKTANVSSELVWFDRRGDQVGVLGERANYSNLELSPDRKQLAVNILDATVQSRDIWLYDMTRGVRTKFTFETADEIAAIWSPRGDRIIFNSRRQHFDLFEKPSRGGGVETVVLSDKFEKTPVSWSPDGGSILYVGYELGTLQDLWLLRPGGEPATVPFLKTPYWEGQAKFSPDGEWVAYSSNESGRFEVYVVPFPGPGGKWQVSTSGGHLPRWARDNKEIFYLDLGNRLVAATVDARGPSFEVGATRPLFKVSSAALAGYSYDVSDDGKRFLVSTSRDETAPASVAVVLNWRAPGQ